METSGLQRDVILILDRKPDGLEADADLTQSGVRENRVRTCLRLAYLSNLCLQFLEHFLDVLRQRAFAVLLNPGIGCEPQGPH